MDIYIILLIYNKKNSERNYRKLQNTLRKRIKYGEKDSPQLLYIP